MSTIYTLNGKVLKNSANDKWLIKKEGPTFDSVTIGSQTWMSKNLAIDDGQGGIYTQTVNYGQGDVTEYYYTWDAAVRVAASIQGWHLPTENEWRTLATAVGATIAGTKLKSTYGWSSGNGTDDFGFAVFPAGFRRPNGTFDKLDRVAQFWTADQSSFQDTAYCRIDFDTYNAMESSYSHMLNALSVRLIKDA